MPKFNLGQVVALRSNPSIIGAIIEILEKGEETRYVVFHGNTRNVYYESQLIIVDPEKERKPIPLKFFNAKLTAIQINQPSLSTLYSLHAARINFIPFQFKPVLKLVNSDRPRLLIADEVGVGKTIEAGLILRELQARRDIQSVLVLCPKPLVSERKWQLELKRFDEHFTQLDGPTLRYCINETDLDGRWPIEHSKTIIPFSLLTESVLHGERRQKGLLGLDPPIQFDLVIVDEAHHLRNPNTYTYRATRYFCEHAEAVIFLSATPIQLGNDDLFVLLNLLRPDLIIDRPTFEHMTEPNPFINQAIEYARSAKQGWEIKAKETLTLASQTAWGARMLKPNPEFQEILDNLNSKLSDEQRLKFIRNAEKLHSLYGLINRTRRRDIGKFTIRKPETVTVEFTPQQRRLHDALLELQAELLSRIHDPRHINFMMTTLRRQASSCIHGLAPMFREILSRSVRRIADNDLIDEEWTDALTIFNEAMEELSKNDFTYLMKKFNHVVKMAEDLDEKDPKFEALLTIIRQKQSMPNNKLLIFSTFRHTLKYLYQKLINSNIRVGLVHGDIKDEERLELRYRFSLPRENDYAIDVLLSSEVGCEGLDYQFCDCLINYDIPWNPMRVEQRIGRLDRYGQKSETILIYNFITPDTVDADIYERCLMRIGVFRRSLGGSEEILGQISRKIKDIAENYQLTDEERREKLQQLADNEIRFQLEQEELEERQAELFGIELPFKDFKQEIEDLSSWWLSPEALQNLIEIYLQKITGTKQSILGEKKPAKTLRLNQEARNRLLQDYKALPKHTSIVYREWERWLKGSDAHLTITFDPEYATENREVVFITPVHPLVRQASMAIYAKDPLYVILKARDNSIAEGVYPFAIYKWEKTGIKTDTSLKVVSLSEAFSKSFSRLIKKAQDAQDIYTLPDQKVFDELDREHYKLWSSAKKEHIWSNSQFAEYRIESLKTSHKARMNQLADLLEKADNKKIKRMREAQIEAAKSDFQRRLKEIETAKAKADIISEPIAYGVFIIERGDKDE